MDEDELGGEWILEALPCNELTVQRPSRRGLLIDAHARSTLAQMNLRDFLTEHERPQRQIVLWKRALDIVTGRLAQ